MKDVVQIHPCSSHVNYVHNHKHSSNSKTTRGMYKNVLHPRLIHIQHRTLLSVKLKQHSSVLTLVGSTCSCESSCKRHKARNTTLKLEKAHTISQGNSRASPDGQLI